MSTPAYTYTAPAAPFTQQFIRRTADGAYIPATPANADYVAYLAWIADGNTPPAGAPTS